MQFLLCSHYIPLDSWSIGEEVGATSVCFLVKSWLLQLISDFQAFQDETESEFMVVTAIGCTCTIWKAVTVG